MLKNELTGRSRWEKLVYAKLVEFDVPEKHHNLIVEGVEGLIPMTIILLVSFIAMRN